MPTYNFTASVKQECSYENLATAYKFYASGLTSPQIQRVEVAPKDNDGLGYLNNTTGGYTNGEAFPNRTDPTKYISQPVGKFNAATLTYNTDDKTRYGITGGGYEFKVTRKHQP